MIMSDLTPESFYVCPLPKCEWSTPFEWPPSSDVEHVLRDHFESHDVIEWITSLTAFKPIDPEKDWVWCEDEDAPHAAWMLDSISCEGPHRELFIRDYVYQEEKEEVNG